MKFLVFIRDYLPQIAILATGTFFGVLASHFYYQSELFVERTKVMQLISKYTQEKASQEKHALQAIQVAQQRGDALLVRLDTAEQKLAISTKEKQRVLQQTTSGHACFNSSTVRLLNEQVDRINADVLPKTTSEPIAKSAGFATDTVIAKWIVDTQQQYRLCQAQLDALIQFEVEGNHTP